MSDENSYMEVLNSVASTVATEVRKYSGEVAEYVDDNFDRAADVLRDKISSATWLPETIRINLPLPRTPPADPLPALANMTLYERTEAWVLRHRVATGIAALVFGTVAYRGLRRLQSAHKCRRARRARSGARCEVVVIAASPALPVTQSLALDLERRGFLVYVVCGSAEDEHAIRQMSRTDIRPLSIDMTDSTSAAAALDRFALYLQAPHAAVPGARKSSLTLTGIILIPSLNYQTSPIATIPPSSFADLFNTHLLYPILSIQAFLPLLTARTALQPGEKSLMPASLLSAASSLALGNGATAVTATGKPAKAAKSAEYVSSPPKVLVFTPSIISSVNPPFHAPESTVCSALSAFTEVLAAELRPLAIPVTHIQLGTFDFSGFAPSRNVGLGGGSRIPPPIAAETLAWPERARYMYGRNFTAQSASALGSGRAIRGVRGTAMRDLHHAVFDVLDGSNTSSVVRIGLGADLYGFVGSFIPRGLVAWMMGVRRVDGLESLYQPMPTTAAASGAASGGPLGVSPVPTPNMSVVSATSETSSLTAGQRSKQDSNAGFVAVAADEAVADSHIWR